MTQFCCVISEAVANAASRPSSPSGQQGDVSIEIDEVPPEPEMTGEQQVCTNSTKMISWKVGK